MAAFIIRVNDMMNSYMVFSSLVVLETARDWLFAVLVLVLTLLVLVLVSVSKCRSRLFFETTHVFAEPFGCLFAPITVLLK